MKTKYTKTEEGVNITFGTYVIPFNQIGTLDFQDLKELLQDSGWGNVLGFRVTEKGIDIFADKVSTE